MNLSLPDRLLAIHREFAQAHIPHAFGGAIALAYYGQPRATYDIDVNIALRVDRHGRVLDALSSLFPIQDRARIEKEILQTAQTRLRWGAIPVDLFFADLPFHASIASRTKEVEFAGTKIHVISAEDLIICKSAYDRRKDWLDIESIFQIQRQHLDQAYVRRWLDEFFPPEDERIRKIEGYIADYGSGPERL
ncbi:MAG: nucleotidyltransferase [Chloroflexi bacterium]|nr:nucleotidyltransferase [Chloroflexota bacterium]